MKRILLFVATNILVVTTISIVINLLGVRPYITARGLDTGALMIFCLVWGMAGSLISLAMSRFMAKMMTGAKVIDPNKAGEFEWLVRTVHQISKQAGITTMPEVAVYNSPEVNAFATGPTKNRALVAVSAGLLNAMSKDEIEGVLAHEVAHIQNGDMVTMTLIQGVVNAFVMFFARILSYAISQQVEESKRPFVNMICSILFDILFAFLAMFLVGWFSRQREFRADRGSAKLLGSPLKMAAALRKLAQLQGLSIPRNAALAPMMISTPKSKRFGSSAMKFLSASTHPPLEERLAALGA